MDDRRTHALVAIALGSISFAVGIGICVAFRPWRWSPAWGARTVAGQVIANEARSDDESGKTFRPLVRYEVGGVNYEIKGMGRTPPRYEVGDRVLVAYPPDQPSDGAITGGDEWLPVLMFGGCGLLFVIIGTSILRSGRGGGRA